MSAKINLAPEVYQESQRNKGRRKIVTSISIIVCAVSVGLVILGVVILTGQALYIKSLQGDIVDRENKVKSYSDLQDAVTAQQHLHSLSQLYGQKVYFSRFFKVLESIAPQGLAVTNISISKDNVLQMTASAKSYDLVTKFAKALEASNTEIGDNASPTQKPYFSDLQLASVSNSGSSGGVDFKLTAQMSTEVTTDGK